MEDLELDNTKKKLFQKAIEVANHDGSTGAAVVPQHQHQDQFAGPPSLGPPLSINLDTTDGGIEHAGVNYRFPQNQSGGQFSVGETMEHNVPTNYRVNAGYGTPNYQLNFSHGTRGYGVNLRSQMQF